MFEMLSEKTADIAADILAGTGPQGRARKLVMNYRRAPTTEAAEAALAALNSLEPNIQSELRSRMDLRN